MRDHPEVDEDYFTIRELMHTRVLSNTAVACRALLQLLVLMPMLSSLVAAETKDQKVKIPEPKLGGPVSVEARAAAKGALEALEAKDAKHGLMFDGEKSRICQAIARGLQNDPEFAAARRQMMSEMMKLDHSGGEAVAKYAQIEAVLWKKQKELILKKKPELKEYLEEREKLNQAVVDFQTKSNAPPGAVGALLEEIRQREVRGEKSKEP